jgi:hypothetical protein
VVGRLGVCGVSPSLLAEEERNVKKEKEKERFGSGNCVASSIASYEASQQISSW